MNSNYSILSTIKRIGCPVAIESNIIYTTMQLGYESVWLSVWLNLPNLVDTTWDRMTSKGAMTRPM